MEYELFEEELRRNSRTPKVAGGKIYRSQENSYTKKSSGLLNNYIKKSSNKMVAKSSINFQKVNIHAFKHNAREEEKKAHTIFEEYTKDNECSLDSKEALKKFNELYNNARKQRIQRGLKRTADKNNVLWEAIVNLKSEHKLKDVEELSKKIEKITGFQTIQLAIHKDEGQERDGKLIRKNHHAHITFFTLSKEDGLQMYRREHMTKEKLILLQDITAEHLGMTRGERGSNAKRLGHKDFKVLKKVEEKYTDKLLILKHAIKEQRDKLKEQKATRPEYARLEQVNKDLTKQLELRTINIEQLQELINQKVKTINYQNEKLQTYQEQDKQRAVTIKGEILKERVVVSTGLFKKEEKMIYKNESVEKFIEQSKTKEQELNKKVEQLEKEHGILKEKAMQFDSFQLFTKNYLNIGNLDKLKELIREHIKKPEVATKSNKRGIEYERD